MLLFNFSLRNLGRWRAKFEHIDPWYVWVGKLRLWPFNYLFVEFEQYHPLSTYYLLWMMIDTTFDGLTGERFSFSVSILGLMFTIRIQDNRQFSWNSSTRKYQPEEENEQL